jgi:hypothetical protein
MKKHSHVLVVDDNDHIREIGLALIIAESFEKMDVICIAGDTLEERAMRLEPIEIKRICDMEDNFPLEPKPRFSDRWKGGTGPGSTAPIRRGRKR